MVKISIEDIVFFIFILIIIGTAIWLMNGSPTEMNALITIGIAVVGSEFLLWKKIFSIENNFNSKLSKIDKNTSLGFIKVKHDLSLMENKIMNKLNNIENRIK